MVLGLSTTLHAAPPRKGHVAVLLDENLMAIFGGYDGTARSDIYVYKVILYKNVTDH